MAAEPVMIRRLIARLRHRLRPPESMEQWRAWQHEAFCRRLREGDFL